MIILLVWLLLACFNVFKIRQSSQGADMIETALAVVFAPLYTILGLVVVFIIKPWN